MLRKILFYLFILFINFFCRYQNQALKSWFSRARRNLQLVVVIELIVVEWLSGWDAGTGRPRVLQRDPM